MEPHCAIFVLKAIFLVTWCHRAEAPFAASQSTQELHFAVVKELCWGLIAVLCMPRSWNLDQSFLPTHARRAGHSAAGALPWAQRHAVHASCRES